MCFWKTTAGDYFAYRGFTTRIVNTAVPYRVFSKRHWDSFHECPDGGGIQMREFSVKQCLPCARVRVYFLHVFSDDICIWTVYVLPIVLFDQSSFVVYYNVFKNHTHTHIPIGSMYAIYGNIYHQYTPNVSIYTNTMDPMGYSSLHTGRLQTARGIASEVCTFLKERARICGAAEWFIPSPNESKKGYYKSSRNGSCLWIYGLFHHIFQGNSCARKRLATHGFSSKKRAVIIDGKHREPLNTTSPPVPLRHQGRF